MPKNNNKNNKNSEIIYGKNACLGCILSNYKNREIYKIYIQQDKFDGYLKQIPQQFRGIVQKVNRHEMFVITHEESKHQGIALSVSNFHFAEIDEVLNLKSVFVLDQVQDPHNVGNIIRSAFCFGVQAIILPERDSCGITQAVVRTSAGYSESSLIVRVGNLNQALEKMKKAGFVIVGFDVNINTKDSLVDVCKKYEKVAFVFGSEGSGMRDLTKKNCDLLIKIPMVDGAESLNVANTSAIVAYERFKNKNID